VIKVRLIAAHTPAVIVARQLEAAVLDAAVVIEDPKLEFELKIAEFNRCLVGVVADVYGEGIALGRRCRGGNAGDRFLLNRPELGVTVPAAEGFAVEQRLPFGGRLPG
jgi:hypothetical protein